MKWWQRGNIISLQVNKNRTKCFTSAPAFWILAWQYAGSASMLHSSLLQKEDGDLNTGLYCQCQMSPHVVETIQGGVPHLTNHTPCLFSVSSTVERCSTPPQTHCDDTQHSLTWLKWLHTPSYHRQILLKMFSLFS